MTSAAAVPLEEIRTSARTALAGTPMPSATEETWRRTDPKLWGLQGLTPGAVKPPALEIVVPPELAAAGVVAVDLETAARRFPDRLRAALDAGVESEYSKWELANRSYAAGAFVFVPRGARSATAVHLIFRHPAGTHTFPRVIAYIEEGSDVNLIEEHVSADPEAAGTSAAISSVVLAPGARAGVCYVQELGARAVHFWHQRCVLGAGAELTQLSLGLGARVSKSQLNVRLEGQGASARLFGILFGSASQHFDPHTTQHHLGPKTSSDMLFRSVLRDKARSIYTGLIRIEKEARDTEAYQADHNLLLSATARADSTPVLEILTNAVRCKHGATAGPLPAEELFYLGCRGVPEAEAKRLLVLGFFDPILSRLPETLRVGLSARVEARLEGI